MTELMEKLEKLRAECGEPEVECKNVLEILDSRYKDESEIVAAWLKEHGFDGLHNDECVNDGCELCDDFPCCGELEGCCIPAYLHKCDNCAVPYESCDQRYEGGFCMKPTKPEDK